MGEALIVHIRYRGEGLILRHSGGGLNSKLQKGVVGSERQQGSGRFFDTEGRGGF